MHLLMFECVFANIRRDDGDEGDVKFTMLQRRRTNEKFRSSKHRKRNCSTTRTQTHDENDVLLLMLVYEYRSSNDEWLVLEGRGKVHTTHKKFLLEEFFFPICFILFFFVDVFKCSLCFSPRHKNEKNEKKIAPNIVEFKKTVYASDDPFR